MVVENNSQNLRRSPMILFMPGASATGRDFLLEQLLANPDVVGQRLGLGGPIKIGVVKKTTTRPPRATVAEMLKICVDDDTFQQGLNEGQIIAPYVLESNGYKYGYHRSSFETAEDADVLVSDASVYQVPALKQELGSRVYTAAMIATRQYREENLMSRGSENPQEMTDRLNLGDAHVVLAILMNGDSSVSYYDFVPADFAGSVSNLISAVRENASTAQFDQEIEKYSRSKEVVSMIKILAGKSATKHMDELVILGPEHRVTGTAVPTETKFFDLGIRMLKNTLDQAA